MPTKQEASDAANDIQRNLRPTMPWGDALAECYVARLEELEARGRLPGHLKGQTGPCVHLVLHGPLTTDVLDTIPDEHMGVPVIWWIGKAPENPNMSF